MAGNGKVGNFHLKRAYSQNIISLAPAKENRHVRYIYLVLLIILPLTYLPIAHSFRGNQNRELAQQWLEKLNDQWELQRFLQDCHEVGSQPTVVKPWDLRRSDWVKTETPG